MGCAVTIILDESLKYTRPSLKVRIRIGWFTRSSAVKLPVTENGVQLPKSWFGNAEEVEVRKENGHLEITAVEKPTTSESQIEPYSTNDPIWNLGRITSNLPISDASVNLDAHLYGDSK
jgi:hypothetical protein